MIAPYECLDIDATAGVEGAARRIVEGCAPVVSG
jgi:hypothetical protein